MDAAAEPAAVGARPVRAGASRRSRSSTRRASASASSRSSARTGRSCRPRPASSIRCCRPASRSRSLAFNDLRTRWRASARPTPGLRPASARPPPGLCPGSARARPGLLSGLGPGVGPGSMPGLVDYERQTQAELDATEQLVAALYASMADFELFKRLTLLYFAAASYSEAVRRLGHPEKAPGFLLHADPPVRAGAAALRRRGPHDARRVRGSPRRAHTPVRGHRSRHRAVRHRRPARSQPARLVSGPRRRSRRRRAEAGRHGRGDRPAARPQRLRGRRARRGPVGPAGGTCRASHSPYVSGQCSRIAGAAATRRATPARGLSTCDVRVEAPLIRRRPRARGIARRLVLWLVSRAGRAGGDLSRSGDRLPHGARRARDQPGAAGAAEARSRRRARAAGAGRLGQPRAAAPAAAGERAGQGASDEGRGAGAAERGHRAAAGHRREPRRQLRRIDPALAARPRARAGATSRRPTRWRRRSSGRARPRATPRRSVRSRRCSPPPTTCRRASTRSASPPSAATPPR